MGEAESDSCMSRYYYRTMIKCMKKVFDNKIMAEMLECRKRCFIIVSKEQTTKYIHSLLNMYVPLHYQTQSKNIHFTKNDSTCFTHIGVRNFKSKPNASEGIKIH